jgi:hypothetical protein
MTSLLQQPVPVSFPATLWPGSAIAVEHKNKNNYKLIIPFF